MVGESSKKYFLDMIGRARHVFHLLPSPACALLWLVAWVVWFVVYYLAVWLLGGRSPRFASWFTLLGSAAFTVAAVPPLATGQQGGSQ